MLDNTLFDPAYRKHHRRRGGPPLRREDTEIRRKVRLSIQLVVNNMEDLQPRKSAGGNAPDEHVIQAIVNTVRQELQNKQQGSESVHSVTTSTD